MKAVLAGLLILAAAIVFAAHYPVLQAGAVTIDDGYLFDNPVLQQPSWASAGTVLREVLGSSTVEGYYEPLTLISLMLDVRLGGSRDDLTVFHLHSLILHVANTLLVIVFLYMLFGEPWPAFIAGLLFGLHPLTVEPLAWVWERKTPLATFFALCCLISYVRYTRQPGKTIYPAIVALFVLALMAKPTVTPLPALLLLLDFWPLRRLSRRAFLEKAPLFAIAAVSGIITVISTARTGTVTLPAQHTFAQIPLKICYLAVFYAGKIVWPADLSSVYVLPKPMSLSQPLVILGVVGTAALIVAVWASLRWTRAVLAGCLFFLIAIGPTFGIVGYSWVSASDKYVYLPSIGLLMVLVAFLTWLWRRPLLQSRQMLGRVVIGLGVLILCGAEIAGTRRCLEHWRDSEGRTQYMLGLAPDSAVLHDSLGSLLSEQGKPDQAVTEYAEAVRLEPDYAIGHSNFGLTLVDLGRFDEAAVQCRKALRLDPAFPEAHNHLGMALAGLGDLDEAVQHYNEAVRLRPPFPEAHNNLGLALARQRKFDRAAECYAEALRLKPAFPEAHFNLANLYVDQGKLDKAVAEYMEALRLRPEFCEAHYNLGITLVRQNKVDEAVGHFRKAIEINPAYEAARDGLNAALEQQRTRSTTH